MDIANLVGWFGSALILGAFALVTRKGVSRTYQKLNLLGAGLLWYDAAVHDVPALVFLNAVWMVIAIWGLTNA